MIQISFGSFQPLVLPFVDVFSILALLLGRLYFYRFFRNQLALEDPLNIFASNPRGFHRHVGYFHQTIIFANVNFNLSSDLLGHPRALCGLEFLSKMYVLKNTWNGLKPWLLLFKKLDHISQINFLQFPTMAFLWGTVVQHLRPFTSLRSFPIPKF